MTNTLRLWAKINQLQPHECWPWTAAKNDHGYGQFAVNRKVKPAHRVVYEEVHGPIPDGAVVDHTCHNESECAGGDTCPHRACCNPAHLEAVTQKVNNNRGKRHAGPRKTHCPRGHEHNPTDTRTTVNKHGSIVNTCRICERDRIAKLRSK